MKTIVTNKCKLKKKKKTKNFDPDIDINLSCNCSNPKCDKRSVKLVALTKLQFVRDDYGMPMIVTSGGRCPFHPNEKHRDNPADHQNCVGVDIKITGITMAMRLMALGVKHGFNAFGINLKSGFIHMGYREELKDKIVCWEY